MGNPENVLMGKKMVDKNRTYNFLARLYKDFDEVQGHIIKRESLPQIEEVLSEFCQEEYRGGDAWMVIFSNNRKFCLSEKSF